MALALALALSLAVEDVHGPSRTKHNNQETRLDASQDARPLNSFFILSRILLAPTALIRLPLVVPCLCDVLLFARGCRGGVPRDGFVCEGGWIEG